MIGYSIPYKEDDNNVDDAVLYCPNCKQAGLYKKLHDVYKGKVQCDRCGKEFNRVDVE